MPCSNRASSSVIAQSSRRRIQLSSWRELGKLTDKTMADDLFSKRKTEVPVWQYVGLRDDRISGNINGG